ncbi:uncharacterized protein LOC125068784 [Vanessa atalanta]|uniref:uncharacterized protein LOC125068784 n=1 Tax=Vanessa atalanta TaxID=42275 RepID=UPI001FCD8F5E|nr:uncharacterized protein LOC125068784 [Vanessa atalanta]
MPPNATDSTFNSDPEGNVNNLKSVDQVPQAAVANTESYSLKIFQSSLNLLAHILIGATVWISILYSFRNGLPLGATPIHIILCVIGYQLLMGEAILSLCPHNGWSASLRLVDKRRAHTVLQILGSGLAIAGSIIKALDKSVNWNTLHGQFGLVAMVFTSVCLVNGLSSLYAFELRKCLPGNLSKITHICFGIVAFGASCICLCYGFDKNGFKNWSTPALAYTSMGFTACFTAIIIINPTITFFNKTLRVFKK